MAKKETTALRFKAYKAIKEKIIYLDFKPGEKIFENELAKSLNVSRTPVREALLMLEHEKLVSCTDSLGFIVRRFSTKDIEEYFALRKVIEDYVIPLAVERITKEEIANLKENIAESKRLVRDSSNIHAIVRNESEFHDIIYRATKAEVLYDTISKLVGQFQWFRALALSTSANKGSLFSQHELIVDLIEKRDIKALKKLMCRHLDEAQERILHSSGSLLL